MYLLHGQAPAHTLRNDTHVGAMKESQIISDMWHIFTFNHLETPCIS